MRIYDGLDFFFILVGTGIVSYVVVAWVFLPLKERLKKKNW